MNNEMQMQNEQVVENSFLKKKAFVDKNVLCYRDYNEKTP